jgi:hypothetical protein
VRDLPAQRRGVELAGALERGRGGDAGALGAEPLALTEPDQDPALALGVRDGELAEAAAGLAGLEQALEEPVLDVVRDVLAFEHADDDGVGLGLGGVLRGGGDAHQARQSRSAPAASGRGRC